MEILSKEDLTINGVGSSAGGSFRHVELNGSGKVVGDVACQTFESNGKGTVTGNLHTEKMAMSGAGTINGCLQSTDSAQIDGKGLIEKDVMMNRMTINGYATMNGSVKGNELTINGKVSIHGDCEVEQFKTDGAFTIDGLLNADQIIVKAHGNCKAKEIGGQDIHIRAQTRGLLKFLTPFLSGQLETDLIEGNTIKLEGTHAKVVRGEHIIIGPNCDIGLVEYTGTLQNSKGSNVKEARKL
ncbi:cytoplasmic protein [Pullulanibacillus sp. KACC 23026]|uniref:polymer-forming cytoskeletal protein n=1 Tax=Pullulanibacillus sp. KACC 23026 TaxID=3028315 RepID=UPI0023B1383F|nr:polymer-forming cytoskeletal protein [Pullulanibacillus sp. KACC 23026]WEG12943.1 cytoplasmic protein [Pullulanibacillus sp. KACC 23026]